MGYCGSCKLQRRETCARSHASKHMDMSIVAHGEIAHEKDNNNNNNTVHDGDDDDKKTFAHCESCRD